MSPLLVVIALTLTFVTCSPKHPVTFTAMGKVIYSGDRYIVPIALNTDDLISMTEPLLTGLLDTRKHYDMLTNELATHSRGHPYTEFVQAHFPISMQSHLGLLMDDLHTRILDLKSMLATLANYGQQSMADPLKLHKRSAFDFVGSAASYLFGLVDNSEYKELTDIIDQLSEMSEQERKTLNLHSKVLNVTALHIDALEANQARTREAIRTLDNNMRAINMTLASEHDSIYTLENSVRMISAISYAASSINDLDYLYHKFTTGLNAMTRGVLSPEILPPVKLVKIIDELNKVNLRALWPSTDPFIPLYYKFASVLPIKAETFMFYVMIPLYPEPKTVLDLFKVTALPFPIQSNVTISYGPMPSFFAVSPDHALHTDLSNADLENCKRFNSIYFCHEARSLYKSNYPSCTFSLYTGLNIDQHCRTHVGTNLERPLIIRDNDRWLYATSSSIHMTVVCPSKTTTIKLDIGVGFIEIPSNCRVNSQFAQLPTSQNIKRLGTEVLNFTLIRPFNISLSEQEHSIVNIFNDSLYQDILSLTGNPVPLHSLSQEIGQLRTIQKHRIQAATQSHYALIMSLAVVIIIILMIILACYLKRVLKENRDRFGAPSNNPIINLLTPNRTYRPVNNPVTFNANEETVSVSQSTANP